MSTGGKIPVSSLVERQRAFFNSGKTRPVSFRKAELAKLRDAILANEAGILDALAKDLCKSDFEAFTTELVGVLGELKHVRKNLAKWAKTRKTGAGLFNFPGKALSFHDPHGVCLIMSPWNYPFMLTLSPVIGAIAAGNTVIVKPSAYSPATSAIIAKILSEAFEPDHVACVEGGRDVNQDLLSQRFDYIFFTGSVEVGKLVMESASKFLTPVTLELGGKSPCIVDSTADIALAARRIAWGKCLNSGQTCVAPDYLLVHQSVKDKLVAALKAQIRDFYGNDPHLNPEFPRIVNRRHFDRLTALIALSSGSRGATDEPRKPGPANALGGAQANPLSMLVSGGRSDFETLKIEPTIIDGVTWDDPLMQEEIFGPIIPIITWREESDITEKILARPRPLAFYLFSADRTRVSRMINRIPFGGGCVNDTVMHLATDGLPFGGTGESGMGCYHGKYSFDTFSRVKGVLDKSTVMDVKLRYPPFAGKYKKFRKFL